MNQTFLPPATYIQARSILEGEVRRRLPELETGRLSDTLLFAIWSLVDSERDLWHHAQPHHHREIAIRRDNAKKELFGI